MKTKYRLLSKLKLTFILLTLHPSLLQADFIVEPYIGYGTGQIQLNEQAVVDGLTRGFELGFKFGYQISKSLYVAADYFRSGPFEYKIENTPPENPDVLLFNLDAIGLGLGVYFGSFSLWGGIYPQSTLEELTFDFRYKGKNSVKLGLGIELAKDLWMLIQQETHVFTSSNLNFNSQNLVCPSASSCETGRLSAVYLTFSTPLN